MKKLLVATHGAYASGAVSAASIIAGEKPFVTCINAYSEVKNLNEALASYFKDVKEEDQVIVLTDLFGGSVNQAIMPYTQKANIFLITGFNLAILLELMMMDQETTIEEDQLRSLVEGGKAQILYVNDVLKTTSSDDFDEEGE